MFETLSDRLGGVLKGLRNRGRLTESDVVEVLAEVRTALLEADVNVGVVRDVIERIRINAVGA
ncbi:MAG: signal recognition particle receptor subunit alpha, partial [Ilumatobacteraceae bacterium]